MTSDYDIDPAVIAERWIADYYYKALTENPIDP